MKEIQIHELEFDIALTGGIEMDYLDAYFKRSGDAAYKMHTHRFYEVVWFTEDGGTHTVDFEEYPIKKNTFFFISPGQVHQYDHTNKSGLAMKFMPEFLNDESTTEEVYLKYNVFNAFDSAPCLTIENERLILSIHRCIVALQNEMGNTKAFAHHSFMQSMVRVLLIIFQRFDSNTGNLSTESVGERVTLNITNNVHNHFIRFRQALEREYKHLHNVKEYANLLGVGTKYLTTIVKECSHRTPLQLINERILLEAKRQLRFSNLMVKEIAFNLGYEDPSYFVKQFKHHTGMLPSEFREK